MDIQDKTKIFLVLVPHRDVRGLLQKQQNTMVKSGINGVYPFPLIAPLACLSKPLDENELKDYAKALRQITNGEKIKLLDISTVGFSSENDKLNDKLTLFGYKLDLELPLDFFYKTKEKIKDVFISPIIGSFLIPDSGSELNKNNISMPVSFRAAALANMFWQPVEFDTEKPVSFKWKIGKLNWLPRNL